MSVTLRASYASGLSSTQTQSVRISAGTIYPLNRRRTGNVTQPILCGRTVSDLRVKATRNAWPSANAAKDRSSSPPPETGWTGTAPDA